MERKVWSFIAEESLIQEGQTVAAAVSGGADSLALLLCLHELSRERDFDLVAAHVEHGIRGAESVADADFVADRCRDLGIPLYLKRIDVPDLAKKRGVSLELAGRQARDEFFTELRRAGAADVAATAHHRDDNAESVLMHVLRGCGVDGLTGILPQRGMLIRPFLCLSKEEILAYLRERGETWREDATNSDVAHTRNYLRSVILPELRRGVNPRVADSLNRLSDCARRDARLLEKLGREAADGLVSVTDGEAKLNVGALLRKDRALIPRIILEAMRALGRDADVENAHIQSVERLLRANRSGSSLDLGGGMRARLEYGELIFSEETPWEPMAEAKATQGVNVLANGDKLYIDDVCERGQSAAYREYVDGDKLPDNLTVRNRRPGDVFRPLNAPGSRKLKEYFIDRKVPRRDRDRAPLLADGSRILWVVGHVISHDIRVDAGTRRVCRLTYEPAWRKI